jgi:hypothetical protein
MTAITPTYRMVRKSEDRAAPVHAAVTASRTICGKNITYAFCAVTGRIEVNCQACLRLLTVRTS